MILDAQNEYANAANLVATGASTNIIDATVDRNIGIGEPMAVVIDISAIDASSGDETYTVQLQAAATGDAAFASPVAVGGLVTIPRTIGANSQVVILIPADTATDRYSRLLFTLGGTTPSITYSARLVPAKFVQNDLVMGAGFTIQ